MLKRLFAGLSGLFAAVLIAASLSVPVRAEPVRIAMNFTWQTTYMPLRYGMAKGYFKEAGFEPEILPMQGDDQAMQLLVANKVDYAFMADVVLLSRAFKDHAEATAVYVWNDQQSMSLASWQPLPNPAAMAGKSFATTTFSPGRLELPYILRQNGVDPASVKVETMDFSVQMPGFMAGNFDTIELHSPGSWQYFLATAKAQGKQPYLTHMSDWGFTGYSKMLVVGNSTLREKPDAVKRLVAVMDKSLKGALADASDDEVYELMKEVMPQAKREPMIADWHDFKALVKKPGPVDPKVLEKTAALLKETGMVPEIGSVDKLYVNFVQ